VRTRHSDPRRYRRHLARELDNVSLYRDLAETAEGEHREVLLELAAAEERHARYWEDKLRDLGATVPRSQDHRTGFTTRSLSWLGRRIGVRRLVPLLERVEAGERSRYDDESEVPSSMVAEERIHAEIVASMAPAWRSRASSSIRAAVFGVNDGLVSNLSLVMGMAGGQATNSVVLLAGLAGLVAGAGSMAAGEYISVRSQCELVEAGTRLGANELADLAEREPVAFELLARAWGLADHEAGRPPVVADRRGHRRQPRFPAGRGHLQLRGLRSRGVGPGAPVPGDVGCGCPHGRRRGGCRFPVPRGRSHQPHHQPGGGALRAAPTRSRRGGRRRNLCGRKARRSRPVLSPGSRLTFWSRF